MEVEVSENDEGEIFNGIEVPDAVTESDYEDSEAELRPRKLDHKRKSSNTVYSEMITKRPKNSKWALHRKYRDLLNDEIRTIAAQRTDNDGNSLRDSQNGSTKWTAEEKEKLFFGLSSFGKDSVRAIATHIQTKTEPEVQAYIQLLHSTFVKSRFRARVLELPSLPAALEIGEECCQEIEEIAYAFMLKQEEHEAQAERQKWGDSWLVTPEVSHWLNRRQTQQGGTKAVEEVLPAATLFNIDKWLELSRRIFMNPGPPNEDENWQHVAEEGEVPAIRATALEDFYSLAIFVTKKLVSTTLFCTMSRERATKARKVKHAEVTRADVEAAAKTLHMPLHSEEFWRGCARRCGLHVVTDDDEIQAEGVTDLTWDQVEILLLTAGSSRRCRSRSHSIGNIHGINDTMLSRNPSLTSDEHTDGLDEDRESRYSPSTASSPPPSISSDASDRPDRPESARNREDYELALENYTEILDSQTSLTEELQLWKILKKDPPETVIARAREMISRSAIKPKRIPNEYDDRLDWRGHVHFKSEWQVIGGLVPDANFTRNRKLKRMARKADLALGQSLLSEEVLEVEEEDEQATSELDTNEAFQQNGETSNRGLGSAQASQGYVKVPDDETEKRRAENYSGESDDDERGTEGESRSRSVVAHNKRVGRHDQESSDSEEDDFHDADENM